MEQQVKELREKLEQLSPFYLATGQHPLSTLNSVPSDTNVPSTDEFLLRLRNLMNIAMDHIALAQTRQERYANQSRREETFEVGEKVLLSTAHIHLDNQPKVSVRKLQHKYIGPFEVLQVVSPVAYKLRLPESVKAHPTFHVSLLKRYQDNTPAFPTRGIPKQPPIHVNGHEEWEVDRLMDKRRRRNRIEYLVKWKGYEDYDSTWEPIANLENAQQAIAEYEAKSNQVGSDF